MLADGVEDDVEDEDEGPRWSVEGSKAAVNKGGEVGRKMGVTPKEVVGGG